jgi:hypothetical protein
MRAIRLPSNDVLSLKAIHIAYFSIVIFLFGCASSVIKPVALNSDVRRSLVDETEIRVIHFEPWHRIWFGTFSTKGNGWYSLEDPLIEVKQQFLNGLQENLSLKNIRSISQYRLNNNLPQLKRTYMQGLVLSFHTSTWKLIPYRCVKACYRLEYSVVARLIHVESENIAWQKECHAVVEEAYEEINPSAKFRIDEMTITKLKRDQAATMCANDLLHDFLGK